MMKLFVGKSSVRLDALEPIPPIWHSSCFFNTEKGSHYYLKKGVCRIMTIDMRQTAAPTPVQLPSAWLIAANEVLALSSADLQLLIHEEQLSNPALEVEERPACPVCGRALYNQQCPTCQRSTSPAEPGPADPPLVDEGMLWPAGASGGNTDEMIDPITLVPARVDLKEHLQVQMHLHLPARDAPLIEYLVGSLDEDGYLSCTIEEVAQLFEVPLKRVQSVLDVLQAQEPAGIGARSVQECLLLQLRRLELEDKQEVIARIIADHLTLLGQGKYREIARALGIPRLRVEEAIDVIKQQLTPFPLRGHPGPHLQPEEPLARTITPDVIISRQAEEEGGGYEVEIAEAERFCLSTNVTYLQAAQALGGSRDKSYRHIHEYLARTRLFISNIKRRWETLASITHCLVELQPDFLTQGRGALRPLTRAELAERLDIHPSTVSRATADKYIMLPNSEVVPFSLFFESNMSTKEALKEIVSQETRPLSDQRMTDLLHARGIPVARRTVAKYRQQLGLLPSTLRQEGRRQPHLIAE
jgi:RNA polymerase sigma-54 factor